MKTVHQVLLEIRNSKTCSIQQLYRYFKAANIMPIGARQRPQLYPDDTTVKVLTYLGLQPECPNPSCSLKVQGCIYPSCPNQATGHASHIPTLEELKKERAQARRARTTKAMAVCTE